MPETTSTNASVLGRSMDRKLLLSLALSPFAAGVSTVVGFAVAHWITIVGFKRTGYLVSACCFILCAAAAWFALKAQRKLSSQDETLPEEGRRLFMAKLALLLSILCTLVVLADTLVLITLWPND